jgi:hypothetical protein
MKIIKKGYLKHEHYYQDGSKKICYFKTYYIIKGFFYNMTITKEEFDKAVK